MTFTEEPVNAPPKANKGKLPAVSPEDSIFVQKQCIQCRKFYREIDNNFGLAEKGEKLKPVCFYHRSTTCCTYLDLVSDERNPIPDKQRGCIAALQHVEDPGYSAIVSKFPVHHDTIHVMRQTHERRGVGLASPEDAESSDENISVDDAFIVHRVALTDTLIGISLYYNVKVPDIQRANNLNSHQIFHKKILLIPRPDVPVPPKIAPAESAEAAKIRRQKQLKLFCMMTSCDAEEGKYYMEACDFHIDQAVKEWEIDCEWEKSAGPMARSPLTGTRPAPAAPRRKARTCC